MAKQQPKLRYSELARRVYVITKWRTKPESNTLIADEKFDVTEDFDNLTAEILDALEGMVEQHFLAHGDELGDAGLSANEDARDVLAAYRPHRWLVTPVGLRRIDDKP